MQHLGPEAHPALPPPVMQHPPAPPATVVPTIAPSAVAVHAAVPVAETAPPTKKDPVALPQEALRSNVSLLLSAGQELEARTERPVAPAAVGPAQLPVAVPVPIGASKLQHVAVKTPWSTSPVTSEDDSPDRKRSTYRPGPKNSSSDQLVPLYPNPAVEGDGEDASRNMKKRRIPLMVVSNEKDYTPRVRRKSSHPTNVIVGSVDVAKAKVSNLTSNVSYPWPSANPASLHHILSEEDADSRVPVMQGH